MLTLHCKQINFFRKALKSLEVVEPHVKVVSEQQHIDYQFSGLEDNDTEDYDDDDYGYDDSDDEDESSVKMKVSSLKWIKT